MFKLGVDSALRGASESVPFVTVEAGGRFEEFVEVDGTRFVAPATHRGGIFFRLGFRFVSGNISTTQLKMIAETVDFTHFQEPRNGELLARYPQILAPDRMPEQRGH